MDETRLRQVSLRMIEDIVIVWLNSNINESNDDYQQTTAQLRPTIHSIRLFTVPEECLAFLVKFQDVKVFLILSNILGESFIPLVHHFSQLDSVYVYCKDRTSYKSERSNEWIKVKGVYNDVSSMSEQLKRNIGQCRQDLLPISIISSCCATHLNELDPTFMYSQLLKEILINIKYNDQAKADFIQFCRIQYSNNDYQIHTISDFERNYNLHSPVWWYTKEPLLYSMLNKALRTHDIEVIINMRYFLCNLHQQIEQMYSESKYTTSFTVYRGQGISNNDFETMTKSTGGLLSFNSFLSTSFDQEVSLLFARSSQANPNLTGILFEMGINPCISSSSFISLDNISFYPNEKEVLFSMHTVFRIGDIKQIEDRLWQVNLILTSNIDEQLTKLTEHMREEIKGKTEWDQLGLLMIKMGEFDKAEHIYQTLLDATSDSDLEKLAIRQCQLGRALYHTGDLQRALSYYEKSLDLSQHFPCNYEDLCSCYGGIGAVHASLSNYSTSLSYFREVLELREKFFSHDYLKLAGAYNNVGWAYYLLCDYTAGLSYCEKALTFEQKSTLLNHPTLSIICDSIGRIYYTMKNYSSALVYYEKALEIHRKSLPSNHALFATDYANIGEIHYSMGDYPTALSFFQKVLEIRQKTFSAQHVDMAGVYNSIGEVYYAMSENSTALDYFEKALNIRREFLPSTHPHITTTCTNIANVYTSMKKYSTVSRNVPIVTPKMSEMLEIETKCVQKDDVLQ